MDTLVDLHGFADASKRGYAAAVYFCVHHNSTTLHIVAAKNKITPVKQILIATPRNLRRRVIFQSSSTCLHLLEFDHSSYLSLVRFEGHSLLPY